VIAFLVRECIATFQFIEIFAEIHEGGYCLLGWRLVRDEKNPTNQVAETELGRNFESDEEGRE
jgi:hypothetical protein